MRRKLPQICLEGPPFCGPKRTNSAFSKKTSACNWQALGLFPLDRRQTHTAGSLSLSIMLPPNQQHGGGAIASDGSLDNQLLLLTRGGRGAITQLSFCQRTTLRSGFQRGWPTTWGCGLQPEGQDFTGCGFRKTVGNRSYLIMLIMATP